MLVLLLALMSCPARDDASSAAPTPAHPDSTLSFLVIGDWGMGNQGQKRVAQQMAKLAKQYQPRFVISSGDNFYQEGVTSVRDKKWHSHFETVYSDASLQIPWYAVLGNHDYLGNVKAQMEYSSRSDRWNMPAHYYAVGYRVGGDSVLIAFLDTNPFVTSYRRNAKYNAALKSVSRTEQLSWLQNLLQSSNAKFKFVVGHHPVYSSDIQHGDTPELIERLLPVLTQGGVDVYFSGHAHNLEVLSREGVTFVISGAGAETRKTRRHKFSQFVSSQLGVVVTRLTSANIELRFVNAKGNTLYTSLLAQ